MSAPQRPAIALASGHALRATLAFAVVSGVTTLSLVVAWAGAETVALVAAAGIVVMVLAPLLARAHVGRIAVRAPSSHTAVTGATLPLELELENRGPWTARDLLVTVVDGRHAGSAPTAYVAALAPGRSTGVRTLPRFPERGRRDRLRVTVESSFPFGLFRCRAVAELAIDLLVLPRLGRLGPLEDRLREAGRSDELPLGPASCGDFYAVRDWREGEPFRGVAWRLSARRGRLLTRELRRQDLPAIEVVLSTRVVADEVAGRRVPSFERAVSLAGTVVEHFLRRGQRVRLTLAGATVRRLPQARARAELLPQLAALAEVGHEEGEPYDALAVALDARPGTAAVLVLAGRGAVLPAPPPARSGVFVLDVDRDSGFDAFEGMGLALRGGWTGPGEVRR